MSFLDIKMENRKSDFKKGIDADLCTDKRVQHALTLRKHKRCEKLTKLRKNSPSFKDSLWGSEGLIKLNESSDPNEGLIKSEGLIKLNESSDPNEVLKSLIYIRKISASNLEKCHRMITDEIISNVVKYISYVDYPEHQHESLWIMTNLISGSSAMTRKYLDFTNIIDYSLKVLTLNNVKVKHQAIWLLGNAIGEDIKYTNYIVNKGGLKCIFDELLGDLQESKRVIDNIRTCTWVLSNIFLHKLVLDYKTLQKAIEISKYFFEVCYDNESNKNMIWLLSRMYKQFDGNQLEIMFRCLDTYMISKLSHCEYKSIHRVILNICGNLISTTDENTQKVMNMGLLNHLRDCLNSNSNVKDVCWILSNISAGTKDQIKSLIDHNLVPLIMLTSVESPWKIVKECLYTICYIIINSKRHIPYMVDIGAIKLLSKYLHVPDMEITHIILDTLLILTKKYKHIVEELCYDEVEKLTDSHHVNIYAKASKLLDKI